MIQSEALKAYARSRGANLVGVAPVSRFDDAMPEKRPGAILPGARSVVVIGVRLIDGALQSVFRAQEEGKKYLSGLYGTYCSQIAVNLQIGDIALDVANYIEKEYAAKAAPTTSGPFQQASAFSQRRAAVAAGLAEMGWNGYPIAPEYGPRVRFCAVITDAELAPDPLYDGPRLCDPQSCRVCRDICPTKAIGEKACSTKIGEHTACRGECDLLRCKLASYGLVKQTAVPDTPFTNPPKRVEHDLEHLSEEYIEGELKDLTPEGFALTMIPNWKCELCMVYCPAGHFKERFIDRGLSRGSEKA